MFLKKIANWILYNQELMESTEQFNSSNEYLSDNSAMFDKIICDGVHSSTSLGGETSVLDFSFPNDESLDYTSCNEEEPTNSNFSYTQNSLHPINEDSLHPVNEDSLHPVNEEGCGGNATLLNEESAECKASVESIDECSTVVDSGAADTTDRRSSDVEIETEYNDLLIESSSSKSQLTPLCENVEEISRQNCSAKNVTPRCKRSIYTQTDKKPDRQRHSSVAKKYFSPCLLPNPMFEKKSKTFNVSRSIGNPSFIQSSNENFAHVSESAVYGTLFVFGCNGTVPAHMMGSMASKFILRKRPRPNGVQEAFSFMKHDEEPTSISPAKHVISYPLSDNRSVVVAFKHDTVTDMFQIGRYEKPPIDFRVSDINGSDAARNGVSRFACRIQVRRDGEHEARVYASAFDSCNKIFLGEGGLIWKQRGKMDGFTTNGVLIMHPLENLPGVWREVSICGYIYPLRSPKIETTSRPRILEETNVLQDGTLIDLCGVTLLWRTPEGLKKTPNSDYLNRLQSTLHREVPECQLLTRHLHLPRDHSKSAAKKAYVYLSCGHVIGLVLSQVPENLKGWSCPVCRSIGSITELIIGAEQGFYIDREFPAYVFKPCGHAASLKTVEYWSSINVPSHRCIQDSRCPFCGIKLNYIKKFIKLTLPVQ